MIRPDDLLETKSVTDIVDSNKAQLKSDKFKITNYRPGGVFQTLMEIGAQGLADLYKLLKTIMIQMYVTFATGAWLDLKAAEFEVYRKDAVKTKGQVTCSRNQDGPNVPIPAGYIFSTPLNRKGERLKYIVDSQVVLETGQTEVLVPVTAEFAGASHNVGQAMITNMITYISGIDQVSNDEDWLTLEGADTETDASLRERVKNKWSQINTGGSRESYISWAQEITGVVVVEVDDEHPRGQGTVDVIITSSAGIPTQNLIDQVQAHLTAPERKVLTANVLAVAPEAVTVNWDVTLLVNQDYGDLGEIKTRGEEIIDIMFRYGDTENTDIKHISTKLGVIRAQAISNLMTIDYVENVIITTPAADVSVTTRQLAIKGTVSVTAQRVA